MDMYFSANVMFRTLHSNSTIYLSTWLPSGDVKVHTPELVCMIGVGREAVERCICFTFRTRVHLCIPCMCNGLTEVVGENIKVDPLH